MYRSMGKVVCATCCPMDAETIKAREERIATRRERIAAKIEAGSDEIKKQREKTALLDDEDEFEENSDDSGTDSEGSDIDIDPFYLNFGKELDDDDNEFKQRFEKQKIQGQSNISEITYDGEIWVTNVKVAAEYREVRRRDRAKEARKERFETLKLEADECEEDYKTLKENWDIKAEKLLPLELYAKIQEQQKAADRLLEKKQVRIDELKMLMDENDWEFEEYLGYYQKDIVLMGDRIDDQMDQLFVSFITELTLCEENFQLEQEEMLRQLNEEWEDLYEEYERVERQTSEDRKNQALDRFASMNQKHQGAKEEMRQVRRKMEDDYRNLVLVFENYKFASLLNTEKLDYNLEIMRKREQENIIMKSSLKRAVLKLRDRYNTLRDEFEGSVTKARKETQQIIKETKRYDDLNTSAMKNLLHLATIQYHKFMELWVYSEEEVKKKMDLVLDIGKFVFKRMLGLDIPDSELCIFDERPIEVYCFIKNLDYDEEIRRVESILDGDDTQICKCDQPDGVCICEFPSNQCVCECDTASSLTASTPSIGTCKCGKSGDDCVCDPPSQECKCGKTGDECVCDLRSTLSFDIPHLKLEVEIDCGKLDDTCDKSPSPSQDDCNCGKPSNVCVCDVPSPPSEDCKCGKPGGVCECDPPPEKESDDCKCGKPNGECMCDPPPPSQPLDDCQCGKPATECVCEPPPSKALDSCEPVDVCECDPPPEKESDECKCGNYSICPIPQPRQDLVVPCPGSSCTGSSCKCGFADGVCICELSESTSTCTVSFSFGNQSEMLGEYEEEDEEMVRRYQFLNELLKDCTPQPVMATAKTKEDIMKEKLNKLRFPNHENTLNYWKNFLPLVQQHGQDEFWDSLFACFKKYYKLLQERNKAVKELIKLRQQNHELATLLHVHMQATNEIMYSNRCYLPACRRVQIEDSFEPCLESKCNFNTNKNLPC